MRKANAAEGMPKVYDPKSVEQRTYDWWEAQGYFKPRLSPQKPFVISMPPPNVTGQLHLGHAITASIEDLMIRYNRMKGIPTLWVPGSDHAGIATQNVVERALAEEGKTRQDLGREAFVELVWEWVDQYGSIIDQQHRRLGTSCDWERKRFTLDEGLSGAVRATFVRLFKKGLVYRGEYIINWCPRCETALSDLEVEREEEDGKLWYVAYPLEQSEGEAEESQGEEFIVVATTRPETILGDTAVAVHPEDERYKHLVGRQAILPVLERHIPIVTDELVDREFGTGAVKVTPAHDPDDYDIGLRHDLERINVMNLDATMNEAAGPYASLDRYTCREELLTDLEEAHLLLKVEEHRHSPGRCQRCHTMVEPLISTQWFVKIKPLAERAIEAVRDGRIRIIPERFEKVYFNWMENIRDWCISRQLWWGHRIPVWYCDDCHALTVGEEDPTACEQCGSKAIHQDPDVLDTWFSSGLWPFSTLGWPEDTEDMRIFYPTSVMETGYDILFFWVARMVMLGLECTDDIPFDTIYLHGLIRDEQGRKMSKSLGNAIDPLVVMDDYGTDALRFTLATGSTPGNDMKLSLQRVEANRNFANKLWNAARFVVSNLVPGLRADKGTWNLVALRLPDRWIISRHNQLVANVTRLMEGYQFGEAGRQIYDFLWSEFCDWYIEMSKIRLHGTDVRAGMTVRRVLVYVLERTLRLLHPFMPFITEEVWQHLPHEGPALIVADWPEVGDIDEKAEEQMALLMDIIRAIRNARREYNVEPGRRIPAMIAAGMNHDLLAAHKGILAHMAHLDAEKLRLAHTLFDKPEKALTLMVNGLEIYLPLVGMVDLDAEREKLGRELERVAQEMARAQAQLDNADFTSKAPKEIVQKEQEKLESLRVQRAKLQERLAELSD
jgi:valyl-tRNA synthetase